MASIRNGSLVQISRFSFTNKAGGTGMSNWRWDPKFEGTATVRVTKRWTDYETGRRFWGEAVSADLVKYMNKNASTDDKRIFFSQFDLIPPDEDEGEYDE